MLLVISCVTIVNLKQKWAIANKVQHCVFDRIQTAQNSDRKFFSKHFIKWARNESEVSYEINVWEMWVCGLHNYEKVPLLWQKFPVQSYRISIWRFIKPFSNLFLREKAIPSQKYNKRNIIIESTTLLMS